MSRRLQISRRLESYADMRTMLMAMRNVAMIELHNLSGRLERERRAMAAVEDAARDFLSCCDLPIERGPRATLVIGAERSFCGDFNTELIAHIDNAIDNGDMVLLSGSRLAERYEEEDPDAPVAIQQGATVGEELKNTVRAAARWLEKRQIEAGPAPLRVDVVFHSSQADTPLKRRIAPLPVEKPPRKPTGYAPLLNMRQEEFLAGLISQAMLLGLQEVFAISLEAENHRRLTHMNNAIRRLDENAENLRRRLNAARQEDIIQEIETIMLSNATVQDASVQG